MMPSSRGGHSLLGHMKTVSLVKVTVTFMFLSLLLMMSSNCVVSARRHARSQKTSALRQSRKLAREGGKGQWKEGDIRLVRGRARSTGTVLLYHEGKWGAVCDDMWDVAASDVVCRQHGYPAGSFRRPLKMEFGGRSRQRIWITRVKCQGHEQRLLECDHVGWGRRIRHMCPGRWRAVGVVCHPTPTTRRKQNGKRRFRDRQHTLLAAKQARARKLAAAAMRRKALERNATTKATPTIPTGNPFNVLPRTESHNDYKFTTTASSQTRKTHIPHSSSSPNLRSPVVILLPSASNEVEPSLRENLALTSSSLSGEGSDPVRLEPLTPFAMYADLGDIPSEGRQTGRLIKDSVSSSGNARPVPTPAVPASSTPAEAPVSGIAGIVSKTAAPSSTRITRSPADMVRATPTSAPNMNKMEEEAAEEIEELSTMIAASKTVSETGGKTTSTPTLTTTSTVQETSTTTTASTTTTPASTATTTTPSTITTIKDVTTTKTTTLPETTQTTTTTATSTTTSPASTATTTTPSTITTTEDVTTTKTTTLPETTQTTTTPTTVSDISSTEAETTVTTVETTEETTGETTGETTEGKRTSAMETTTSLSPQTGDDDDDDDDDDEEELKKKSLGNVSSAQSDSPGEPEIEFQLDGGRNVMEGRLQVREVGDLNPGEWGSVCGAQWSLREAMVVCRQMGHLAKQALKTNYFGRGIKRIAYYSFNCTGRESSLSDCARVPVSRDNACPSINMVAGVTCAHRLADLVPDLDKLKESARLQDKPLYYLQCAMEENCLSSSAYTVRNNDTNWRSAVRRLLRFSTMVHNRGDEDFRPNVAKSQWQWHSCHMHFHSMEVFAHYDILDGAGTRLAEGSKASFCLEDTVCNRGIKRTYNCEGFGDQGLSVNCSDNYNWDIDCQWIDVTDIQPGVYTFLMEVNPDMLVPEKDFDNNVAQCTLWYSGYEAKLHDCQLHSLLDYRR